MWAEALKMEIVSFFEELLFTYDSSQRHSPEEHRQINSLMRKDDKGLLHLNLGCCAPIFIVRNMND